MKSCITLVLLVMFLASNAFADEDNNLDFVPIKVLNVTMKDSSVVYPDILVLLPNDFTSEQRAEFMEQLAVGMVGDIVESPDNALRADTDADVTRGADEALQEAVLQIASVDSASVDLTAAPGTDNTTLPQIYAVIPTVEEEYIRKRRSLERLTPLARKKRTLKKHSKDSCMVCQLLQPKQPIVINVYKQGGCDGGCGQHYQPPPCGHPQCGYQPQPHPRPPPPPPPVYHQPQQTCDPCNRPPSYQQPSYHQPAGHSYSYSQSSSSSSAGSYNWGKKK